MFISDFAIRRPIITIVTTIVLVVFGLPSLFRLETDELPELDQPIVLIGVAYPGAARFDPNTLPVAPLALTLPPARGLARAWRAGAHPAGATAQADD
jgi:Cu/Ag efflux pump CusA